MITQTEVELYVRIKPYYEFVEFVSTMPGITELSSTIVLAETGVDMNIFDDAKHLCSWCGFRLLTTNLPERKSPSDVLVKLFCNTLFDKYLLVTSLHWC